MDSLLASAPKVPTISPEAAQKEMLEGNPLILDVRTPDAYAAGHIENAINIPYNDQFLTSVLTHYEQKDQMILVYWQLGYYAALAVHELMTAGYTNVASFGGIKDWPYDVV